MNEGFQYSPLQNSFCFRIIKLQPAKDTDETIKCELREIDLGNKYTARSFDALSYTWGSQSDPVEIICNGEPFWIGQNCAAALRRLRRRRRARKLFVDAICINQNPGTKEQQEEKDQQVALMGKIYSKAKTVFAWLGPATVGVRTAFNDFRRLYRLHRLLENRYGDIKQTVVAQKIRDLVWNTPELKLLGKYFKLAFISQMGHRTLLDKPKGCRLEN